MSITAQNLSDAALVSLNGGNEAAHRAAVHQAYYALFHRTMYLAQHHLGAEIGDGSQHSQLSRFMKNHRNTPFNLIGRALESAAAQRVLADYIWEENITFEQAEEHVAKCQLNLQQVEGFIERFGQPPQTGAV